MYAKKNLTPRVLIISYNIFSKNPYTIFKTSLITMKINFIEILLQIGEKNVFN